MNQRQLIGEFIYDIGIWITDHIGSFKLRHFFWYLTFTFLFSFIIQLVLFDFVWALLFFFAMILMYLAGCVCEFVDYLKGKKRKNES